MKGRRWFVGGLAALVAAAAWGPDVRLARELAAARREGLWTSADDVRRAVGTVAEGENAGPEIQRLAKADRVGAAFLRLLAQATDPKAPPTQREGARRRIEGNLDPWRKVSLFPSLDYHRPYEQGYLVLFPELAPFRAATNHFIVAASYGLEPRENLLAAARLAALMRSEPGVITGLVANQIGGNALTMAVKKGCGREVEAALGPPSDVRRVLGPELPALLDTADQKAYLEGLRDLGVHVEPPLTERLMHYGPFARNTKAAGIARWRRLWARLPKDGQDFDGAAKVIDEELPKIDALMPSYAEVMQRLLGGAKRGDFLREIGAFEARRARIRKP